MDGRCFDSRDHHRGGDRILFKKHLLYTGIDLGLFGHPLQAFRCLGILRVIPYCYFCRLHCFGRFCHRSDLSLDKIGQEDYNKNK